MRLIDSAYPFKLTAAPGRGTYSVKDHTPGSPSLVSELACEK